MTTDGALDRGAKAKRNAAEFIGGELASHGGERRRSHPVATQRLVSR